MNFSKAFFILSTFFISTVALSQPTTKVTENVVATFYVRTDSVRKNGSIVEFWQITDFKQARLNKKGESYFSMDHRLVIDCVNSTQTLTFMKVYASPMASGSLIASGSMSQKNPIPNGTSLEVIKNFVCR
jgi:hypothetical protein